VIADVRCAVFRFGAVVGIFSLVETESCVSLCSLVLGEDYSPLIYRNYIKKNEPDRESETTSCSEKAVPSITYRMNRSLN
jgi:hypothetical protein